MGVQTHAEFLYSNPNLDLWPFNPKIMSLLGYPYQVWTLWDHSFLSYAADKQTKRRPRTYYSSGPTQSAWIISLYLAVSTDRRADRQNCCSVLSAMQWLDRAAKITVEPKTDENNFLQIKMLRQMHKLLYLEIRKEMRTLVKLHKQPAIFNLWFSC